MHRLVLPLLALIAPASLAVTAPQAADPSADPSKGQAIQRPVPPGFHLGSFSSLRSARLSADGQIDTGAGVLSLSDGETPLQIEQVDYGRGPTLTGQFSGHLRGLLVEGTVLCMGLQGGGDERSVVALQLKVTNEGRERAQMPLVVTLSPGGGDPAQRPAPSLELQPETRFALEDEDRLVTRDGHGLLSWIGGDPRVEVFERVESATDTAARLTFELDIPPGVGRYLEVEAAGAPTAETFDEQAWRESFSRRTYRDLEESLRWQWQQRGRFANFQSQVPAVSRGLVGSVHLLRSFGIAHREGLVLSDRPYGQAPRDAAVEAEVFGAFMQFNLDEIMASQIGRLTEDLERVLEGLTPERRLAYLYGLVQGLRLGPVNEPSRIVAQALLDHVESVPVRPWLDPAVVRGDLLQFVEEHGLEGGAELPELEWASVDDAESTPGLVLGVRRAMSAGEIDTAWSRFQTLLDRGTKRGMGAWEPGGELDGRYALAMLNLVREMLLDDHGDNLLLFPRLPTALVGRGTELHMDFTPSRYGQLRAQIYAVGRKNMGIWVRFIPGLREAPLIGYFPDGIRPRRLLGKPTGGEAQLLDDGGIRLWIDEVGAGGLRLSAGVGAVDD